MLLECAEGLVFDGVNSLHLQARLADSKLALKDGGAKVATRISSIKSQISEARLAMPSPKPGMRNADTAMPSLMIPVQSSGDEVHCRETKMILQDSLVLVPIYLRVFNQCRAPGSQNPQPKDRTPLSVAAKGPRRQHPLVCPTVSILPANSRTGRGQGNH